MKKPELTLTSGLYLLVLAGGLCALFTALTGCSDPIPPRHSRSNYSPTYLKSNSPSFLKSKSNATGTLNPGAPGNEFQTNRITPAVQTFNDGKGFSTIVLGVFYHPGGTERGVALQKRAQKTLGESDIWLEKYPASVSVNLGHFTTHDKASNKCKSVQKNYLKLRTGAPFCYVKDISPPAPIAPEQWNLLQSNCFYSIEVGRYYNDKDYQNRKKDAVEAVRILRENNEMAFFVHGQTESRIYVGCFNAQDVLPKKQGDKIIPTYSPEIQKLKKEYPYLGENGVKVNRIYKNKITGREEKIPVPSRVVNVNLIRMEIVF